MENGNQKKVQIFVSEENLRAFLLDVFSKTGMAQENAGMCADCMVQTNLWGIDSHGILRLPIYIKRIRNKVIKANPVIKKTCGNRAFELLDGDDGIGFLVGKRAMQRALELAEENNIGAVAVTRSNHFGAAALYAGMAADRGMIGIAMTNVGPNLVVPGGSKPITGNNPIAIGAPTAGAFPFLLDISMSAVSGGKLLLASKKKEKIPMDWATDSKGRFTDDPDKGFAGFLLPLGGHKGFGLSLAIDILCGVITGGAFQFGIRSMYKQPELPSLTGHMMIAINPGIAVGPEELKDRMAEFCSTLKASPMWDESREMLLPGELEHLQQLERQEHGIPVPDDLFHELSELGAELHADQTLEPIEA